MRIFPCETRDYLESYFSEAHCSAYGMLTTRGHGRIDPGSDSGHGELSIILEIHNYKSI